MKRFLLKIFAYIVLLFTVTIGLNMCYIWLSDGYISGTMDRKRNDNAIIKNVPSRIQICDFGSSHSYYGFNYEDAIKKYECFNFALSSQSLRYDCKIMENYKANIQSGATVFLAVSYFSFFGKPEVQEDNFASKNKRYYQFLPAELIDQYDRRIAFYIKYLPALAHGNLLSMLKNIVIHPEDSWSRKTSAEKTNGMERYEYHVANRFDSNGKRIRKQEAIDALYRMISLCRKIGATPVMITTPYLHEYTDAIQENDPSFFYEFYSVIDDVRQNTGVAYYNYGFDERFRNEYGLFIDSDHLNREGARIFTNILLREVLSIDVH